MKKKPKRWSQRVTDTSDALDLEAGVFTWKDPKKNRQTACAFGDGKRPAQGRAVSIGNVNV